MEKFTGPETDIEAIRRIRQQIEDAVNAGDVEAFGQHLAKNVAQLPAAQIIHGRDDVMNATAEAYDAYELDERFHIDTIVVAGDLAVEHGSYELTMTPKDSGDPLHADGLPYVYVYERSQEDDWQVPRISWQTE